VSSNRLDMEQTIAELEARCEKLKSYAHVETVLELKADLAKYGGHTAECGYYRAIKGSVYPDVECDCGYDKSKERWE